MYKTYSLPVTSGIFYVGLNKIDLGGATATNSRVMHDDPRAYVENTRNSQ